MKKSLHILLIIATAVFAISCSSLKDDKILKETTVEYTFPGEWENHEGTWLIWPHNYGIITPEYVDMIDDIWITMTKALHTGERVHIVIYNEAERTRVTSLLESEGVDMSEVDFLNSPAKNTLKTISRMMFWLKK